MLLLGYDSRRQQVKERMPATGAKKDSSLMEYTSSVNLPSPDICPNPSPQSWLSSLNTSIHTSLHSHPHPDTQGFFSSSLSQRLIPTRFHPVVERGQEHELISLLLAKESPYLGEPSLRLLLLPYLSFLFSLSEKSCLSSFLSFNLHSSLYPWVLSAFSPFCPH